MSRVALKVETSRWLSSGKLVAPKEDNIQIYGGCKQSRDFKRYGQKLLQEERAGRGNGGVCGNAGSGMPGVREAPAADGGDEAPRVLL